MSPPSTKKKKTSKAIPSLEADLRAIRTVVSNMESTQRFTTNIIEELTKRTKDLRMELAILKETDKSFQIYNSEHSKSPRPIGRFKKADIYIELPEMSSRWSILWFYI